jgi:uncharacterized protein (DUF736 family)
VVSQRERNTITIIGAFAYNKAKDTYSGELRTLTQHRPKVALRPTEGKTGKGRDDRVVLDGAPGGVELGAAWKRTSGAGREFLSITLDDPAPPHPLSAALMPAEDGAGAILIWSRPANRQPEAA